MSKKQKVITIPLSKILPIAVIIFVGFQILSKPKANNTISSQINDSPSIVPIVFASKSKEPEENIFAAEISSMSHDDITKTMMLFPPDLMQNCDTITWRQNKIIRYFSIDTTLQKKTEKLIRRAKIKYGAAVAINPQTGQILALASLFDEDSLPKIAENLCLSNIFPAASIIKTITAEAAFDNIPNISTVSEKEFTGKSTTLYKSQFLPEEYGRNANTVSLSEAFARSNNPVFGQLAVHSIGRENLVKSAQKFGFNSKIPFEMPCDVSCFPETTPENANDTINLAELGSGFNDETTLTPLLGALMASSTINKGIMMMPTIIDSVSDISGKILFAASPQKWKNCTAENIADSLNILMQKTTQSGSARKAFDNLKKYALGKDIIFGGKTGTKDSKHGRNEWFIGFAKDNKNDFAIATSICFVQYPKFVLRPSQVSADIMLDNLKKTKFK